MWIKVNVTPSSCIIVSVADATKRRLRLGGRNDGRGAEQCSNDEAKVTFLEIFFIVCGKFKVLIFIVLWFFKGYPETSSGLPESV